MILWVKGNTMTEISAQPFVKWAGGKRQLLEQIKARLPKHFNGYMEPFVAAVQYILICSRKNPLLMI